MHTPFLSLFCLICVLLVAGCAGRAPVPGGDDTTNLSLYKSEDEFKQRVARLQVGMVEEEVFAQLGTYRHELLQMSREEIVNALFGGGSLQVGASAAEQQQTLYNLQSLYGYRLDYKNVERHHGFTSPIRIRTDEDGFKYSTYLIFQQGRLFERPVVSGGKVNEKNSKTLFDWLSPGYVFDAM